MKRICDERAAQCICVLDVHDRGAAHQCACGGSWLGDINVPENFQVIKFPQPGVHGLLALLGFGEDE